MQTISEVFNTDNYIPFVLFCQGQRLTKMADLQYLSFEKLSQGRTTVIIAHRLSTVRRADRIAVVEGGRIVELGSHDELMARNGAYAALVRTQELGTHG